MTLAMLRATSYVRGMTRIIFSPTSTFPVFRTGFGLRVR
jgi:hypothetical protein